MSVNDFERVKSQLPLLKVITQEAGLQMKGHHLEACPFCQGHECFSIKDEHYKCFQCNASGDIFNFLEAYHSIESHEALKRAAVMANVELSESSGPQKPKTESLQEKIFKLAMEHYHKNMLTGDPAGRKWFCGVRGHSEETLKKLHVGWSMETLIPFLQKEDIKIESIQKYNLAQKKEDKIKEYFWKGLAIFPVIDHAGTILTFTCKVPDKKYPDVPLPGVPKKWFLNFKSLGKYSETYIVEGENDVASIFDAGLENVVGTKGQPSQDQLRLLKNFCNGKTVYLWFDRDKQKDHRKYSGGASHVHFIYKGLLDSDVKVKIIVHPGEAKDPDEFIQNLFKEKKSGAEIRAIIRDLKDDAVDPLTWELQQIAAASNETAERLEAFKLRGLPKQINKIHFTAEQEIYIELASKSIGISVKAVEELVSSAADLYKHISDAFSGEQGIKKADPYNLANQIFKWFNNGSGARFFKTTDKKVWLFYQRKIYEIGNNLDFNTLMFQLTRLAAIEKPGTTVWYFLQTICNQSGEMVDLMSWMHTDRENDAIYINLNNSHNKIIKIAQGKDPAVIDNGTNEHSILLASSPQIRLFDYQPAAGEAEGLQAMQNLILQTSPCDNAQRYFLASWMISTFLMHYQSDRGLLQIISSSGIGKSKVAEKISMLLYGENYVGKGTGAAETRVAISNPIIFLDNVENRNLTQGLVDFLLLLANSAHKPKAKSGSDTDVLYQKLFTMAVVTSIEAFPGRLPELVNRTLPLMLEPQYKQHGYMHDEVMRAIVKNRNLILSAILKVIGKEILPNLAERQYWSKHIQTQYPGHHKNRNNEHICTMMIILEALLKYIPFKKETPIKSQASELLDRWIGYWDEQEGQTALTSNTLLTLMDGLAKEVFIKMRGRTDLEFVGHPYFDKPYPNYIEGEGQDVRVRVFDDPEYLETFYFTESMLEPNEDDDGGPVDHYQRLEFIISSADLHTTFNRYCANQHIRNPFETATALGARISNDRAVMEKGGWKYIQRKKENSQFKKSQGIWYWRFSKRIKVM